MTDIVERLRLLVPSDSSGAAFDAVNEITRLRNELHIAQVWSERLIAGREQDMTEITALRAEVERLRAALDMIDSISVHSGGDIHGVHPSLWEGAFKEAQIMARAALEEKQ